MSAVCVEWIGKGPSFQELENPGAYHTACTYYFGQGLSPLYALFTLSVQGEAGPIYLSQSVRRGTAKEARQESSPISMMSFVTQSS